MVAIARSSQDTRRYSPLQVGALAPWYLAHGPGRWPPWAQDLAERTCSSLSPERRIRCLREFYVHIGVADPLPKLEGQRYLDASRHLRAGARAGISRSRTRRWT